MAELVIHSQKIQENIKYLSHYFKLHNIEWSLITKIFSGDKTFLKNILTEDVVQHIKSVGDSRLSSLRKLKETYPHLKTVYINPPSIEKVDDVIDYADVSLNTSISIVEALNLSAMKKNVIHSIIIMIEQGELREGVNQENVITFYKSVFNLSHIKVIGIGSNLGCMFGVEPTRETLMQLTRTKTNISKTFNNELKLISGGTSITLPLIDNKMFNKDINHFRIGEAAFLGICPLNGRRFKDLNSDTFELHANIIEVKEKETVPFGVINETLNTKSSNIVEKNRNSKSYKAILDFGILDVDKEDIQGEDYFSFVGATSDMFVIDLGDNKSKFKLGDKVRFKLNYMGVARLLNSKFIEKIYL